MRRFLGESLPDTARIALITNDALGNYVVATPLMQMLQMKYPSASLHYYGGTRITELSERATWFEATVSLYGSDPRTLVSGLMKAAPYDLIVNLENSAWAKCLTALLSNGNTMVTGPCLSEDGRSDLPFTRDERGDLWRDMEWMSPHITFKYPFLTTGFIGEIFARLAYLDGPMLRYALPSDDPGRPVPDVLIATAASLTEKLWPVDSWIALVQSLRAKGLTVGLVGAKPTEQSRFWRGAGDESGILTKGEAEDLRGVFTLPQVVGAIERCRQVITIDNGILHMACATRTPVAGLFRHGIHRLWAPPASNLTVIEPGENRAVSDLSLEEVLAHVKIS